MELRFKYYQFIYYFSLIFLLINKNVYANIDPRDERWVIYELSGLAMYSGMDSAYENLVLVKEHVTIQFIDSQYFHNAVKIKEEYSIRNDGECINAVIGIFAAKQMFFRDFFLPYDLQFFIGEIEHTHHFAMQQPIYLDNGDLWERQVNWALISVYFPLNEIVHIKIEYTSTMNTEVRNFNGFVHKLLGAQFSKYTGWKGTPQFSVAISNYFAFEDDFEYNWIVGIDFFSRRNSRDNFYAHNLLYQKRKINANTWVIQFTDLFLENYERRFFIKTLFWGTERQGFYYLGNSRLYIHDTDITETFITYDLFYFLTNRQLRIMRNAFFARHGFIFRDERLRSIFNRPWALNYQENPNFHEGMLTDIDRANIATIQRLEAMAGDRP